MALDSEVRSKIVRQELDAALVGPAFTRYEARVKYNPENIEKETFFSLCYGMLKVGDEIVLHTYKKDKFNCYYQFLVIDVDKDAKIVKTLLLKKYDFNHPEANVEVEGVDTEALNKAVTVMVNAKLEDIVKTLNELQSNFNKYTTDTDDQLEEIEDAKIVKTLLLKKYDFNHPEANVEVEGVDTEALNKAVTVMVNAKLEDIVKTLNELQSNFNKYTTDTDDQLEEIEDAIDELKGAPTPGVPAPDGSVVDIETEDEDEDETEDEDSDEDDEG